MCSFPIDWFRSIHSTDTSRGTAERLEGDNHQYVYLVLDETMYKGVRIVPRKFAGLNQVQGMWQALFRIPGAQH